MDPNIPSQIQSAVSNMGPEDQLRVLEFVLEIDVNTRKPTLPPGTPGSELLKFVGSISPEDLKEMSDAIEDGCGKVDLDEW